MRKVQFIFLMMMVVFTTAFTSCTNDDNNDGPLWSLMGNSEACRVWRENASFYLDSDYYGNLLVGENNDMNFVPKEGERIVALFNMLAPQSGDYKMTIALEQVYPVLTKEVDFTTDMDSYVNDPIVIWQNNLWVSNGYMNMVFQQALPASTPHTINLVMSEEYQLEDGYVPMQLFYDKKQQTGDRSTSVNVSFNLDKVDLENVKGIVLKINSAVNGEVSLRINLKDGAGVAVPA